MCAKAYAAAFATAWLAPGGGRGGSNALGATLEDARGADSSCCRGARDTTLLRTAAPAALILRTDNCNCCKKLTHNALCKDPFRTCACVVRHSQCAHVFVAALQRPSNKRELRTSLVFSRKSRLQVYAAQMQEPDEVAGAGARERATVLTSTPRQGVPGLGYCVYGYTRVHLGSFSSNLAKKPIGSSQSRDSRQKKRLRRVDALNPVRRGALASFGHPRKLLT